MAKLLMPGEISICGKTDLQIVAAFNSALVCSFVRSQMIVSLIAVGEASLKTGASNYRTFVERSTVRFG